MTTAAIAIFAALIPSSLAFAGISWQIHRLALAMERLHD